MSELPKGWVNAELDLVCNKPQQRTPDANEVFIYIDIGSVDRDSKTIKNSSEILGNDAPSRARKIVNKNDIIVSMTRPNLNAVALIPESLDEQIASTGFDVLKPILVEPKWLFAIVKSKAFIDEVSGETIGALYPACKASDIRGFKAPIPPLAEQKRIVEKLDQVLAQVDTIKARLDGIPAILKRFRQSVLAAAVSGKLTEEWRSENFTFNVDSTQIAQQHRAYFTDAKAKYKEPIEFKATKSTPEIPNSWRWYRAEQLCDLITKGTTPKKEHMAIIGDIPYIKVYNLTFDGSLDFSIEPTFIPNTVHHKELKRSKVFSGDVLMNIVGPPLGKVSIVPNSYKEWNINQAISIFRPVCGVSNVYLSICLRDEYLLELTKSKAKATAGQFNLTLEICRDYSIPVPPLEEQAEIVRLVDQYFAFADTIEQQVQKAQQRVDKLTQSILAKAFRGELVPQDPNDEPADELLKRIAAARAESEVLAKAAKKINKKNQ